MADKKSAAILGVAFFTRRPLLPMALFFMAGIWASGSIRGPWWAGLALAVAGTLCLAVVLLLRFRGAILPLMGVICFGIGLFVMTQSNSPTITDLDIVRYTDKGSGTFEGRIVKPLEFGPDNVTAIVKISRVLLAHGAYMPCEGRLRLRISEPEVAFRYGDTVEFTSRIRKISGYNDPGVFDYQAFNRHRKISATAYVRKSKDVTIIASPTGFSLRRVFQKGRHRIRDFLHARVPFPQNEVVAALVIGERGRIPESVMEYFQKAGVSHLLAISGMHIGLIFGIAYLLMARALRLWSWACRRINIHKAAALVAILPAFFYAELAGWRITTTRAFIMVFAYALSMIIGRRRDLISTISLAALLVLAFWPFSLFEPGFQLSFLSILAISILAKPLGRLFTRTAETDRLQRPTLGTLGLKIIIGSGAITAAAFVASIPITAFHFGTVAPFTILGNLVVMPIYTLLVVPVSLAGAVASFWFPTVAQLIFTVSTTAIDLGFSLSALVARLPGSLMYVSRPTLLEIGAFYLLIVGIVLIRRRGAKILVALGLVVLIGTPIFFWAQRKMNKDLAVTVIDVGQGQSQLVEFPGGETWLIDGGGSNNPDYDLGRSVLGPYLRARRIKTLDRVINSHPHPDHFGGLAHVIEAFDVKELVVTSLNWEEDDRYEKILAKAKALGIGTFVGSADVGIEKLNGVEINWLYPPKIAYQSDGPFGKWSLNDRSMTLKFSQGDCEILLPGDAEAEAENYMVTQGLDINADVMVSPHHGSRSSSSNGFLLAVAPKAVIISAGLNNWYSLPSQSVLDRYEKFGVKVYRTDQDGAVSVRCKKGVPEISIYRH